MYTDFVGGGLTVLNRAGDLLRRGAGSDSLIDFTSVGRVEPIVLIEQNALHLDCIGDVQQSLLSIFAGYYLQAASLMNTIGNVRVLERLDALNPNRSPVNAGLSTWLVATESYEHGLPFPSNHKLQMAVESADANQKGTGNRIAPSGDVKSVAKDVGRTMTELANLSVGKAYEISISDGQHTVPVQVNIRLIASLLPTQDLVHILATGSDDQSFKERWHGWKAGRLAFWKDLVFCNDLIDKHRKDLMKDTSGTLANTSRTNFSNVLTSVITGQPTIASSSQMAVLTKDTAEQLELELEGKLAKFDVRQRMMRETSLMILAVVDEVDYNTVTFYYRNIAQPTTVRIKDLKASSKGDGGSAVMDIMKSLMQGHPSPL